MKIPLPHLLAPIGAGDLVAKATKAIGVKPCTPCEERRRLMNNALQFIPKWGSPPDAPEGWTLEHTFTKPDSSQVIWFRHQDGRSLIWEVMDGKYRRSHGFCRTCPGVEQKYEALCQIR